MQHELVRDLPGDAAAEEEALRAAMLADRMALADRAAEDRRAPSGASATSRELAPQWRG